jgi:hypothetical protein
MLSEANGERSGSPEKKKAWKALLSKITRGGYVYCSNHDQFRDTDSACRRPKAREQPRKGKAVTGWEQEREEENGGDQVNKELTALPPMPQHLVDKERMANVPIDTQSAVLFQFLRMG